MKTLCRLLSHAVTELWALLLTRLDPTAPLRAEIEQLKYERATEKQRGDYWCERTSRLLREEVIQSMEMRRLNLQNASLVAAMAHLRSEGAHDAGVNMAVMGRMP